MVGIRSSHVRYKQNYETCCQVLSEHISLIQNCLIGLREWNRNITRPLNLYNIQTMFHLYIFFFSFRLYPLTYSFTSLPSSQSRLTFFGLLTYLSTYQSNLLSIRLSITLPIYLPTNLSINQSILSTHLFTESTAYQFIYALLRFHSLLRIRNQMPGK